MFVTKSSTHYRGCQAFGLHEGFVAPLHRTEASIFSVLFAGMVLSRTIPQNALQLISYQFITGVLGWQLCSPTPSEPSYDQPLTERQQECLNGFVKERARRTLELSSAFPDAVFVDEHIAHACERLGRFRHACKLCSAANLKGYIDAIATANLRVCPSPKNHCVCRRMLVAE